MGGHDIFVTHAYFYPFTVPEMFVHVSGGKKGNTETQYFVFTSLEK